jgi:hypothetical protein
MTSAQPASAPRGLEASCSRRILADRLEPSRRAGLSRRRSRADEVLVDPKEAEPVDQGRRRGAQTNSGSRERPCRPANGTTGRLASSVLLEVREEPDGFRSRFPPHAASEWRYRVGPGQPHVRSFSALVERGRAARARQREVGGGPPRGLRIASGRPSRRPADPREGRPRSPRRRARTRAGKACARSTNSFIHGGACRRTIVELVAAPGEAGAAAPGRRASPSTWSGSRLSSTEASEVARARRGPRRDKPGAASEEVLDSCTRTSSELPLPARLDSRCSKRAGVPVPWRAPTGRSAIASGRHDARKSATGARGTKNEPAGQRFT